MWIICSLKLKLKQIKLHLGKHSTVRVRNVVNHLSSFKVVMNVNSSSRWKVIKGVAEVWARFMSERWSTGSQAGIHFSASARVFQANK